MWPHGRDKIRVVLIQGHVISVSNSKNYGSACPYDESNESQFSLKTGLDREGHQGTSSSPPTVAAYHSLPAESCSPNSRSSRLWSSSLKVSRCPFAVLVPKLMVCKVLALVGRAPFSHMLVARQGTAVSSAWQSLARRLLTLTYLTV